VDAALLADRRESAVTEACANAGRPPRVTAGRAALPGALEVEARHALGPACTSFGARTSDMAIIPAPVTAPASGSACRS